MIVHKCDKCGKEAPQSTGQAALTPKDWYALNCGRYAGLRMNYELCPTCRKTLKIPVDDHDADKDAAERLIELLTEIANDAVAEALENA